MPTRHLDAFFPPRDGSEEFPRPTTFDTFGRAGTAHILILETASCATVMSLTFPEKTLKSKQRGWRRRHERYRANFPIKASLLREEGYLEIQGRCSDIGQGGMGTVLTAEVAQGEVLSLQFQLPGNTEEILVRAIVRYQKGFVHGMEFLGLTAERQENINAFCEGLTPIP